MIAIHQPSYSGTRKQLAIGVAGFILTCQILLGDNILNIDFGVGATSQKQGPAAIGNAPTDFWNHYSRDDGSGGYRTFGEVFDLLWADGSASTADLTVVNAPGAWGNESQDPMFGVYLYPGHGENITVTLKDLPSGSYALYVYAHGALDGENGVVEVASGGSTWGPLRISTEPGWNVPGWENGRQYVAFDAVVVGADHQIVITVYPGESGLAVLNGLQLIQESTPPSVNLINVDFSGHQNPAVRQKSGPAVLGYKSEDIWNLYSRDDGSGGFLESGSLANLVAAEGSPTGAGLIVQNAAGLWIAGHSDAMLDSYLYPLGGGDMVVTLTNLADGQYDLYFYSHGLLEGENGDIAVRAGNVDYGAKVANVTTDWQTIPWQEGVQYVRFQGLIISAREPLVITVRPGTTGLAVMNGMQLLRQSDCSPPSGLVAWWPGEGDGTDVVGGHDGELVNGLGFAEGLVGQAFNFDAPGEHLVTPTLAGFAADSFTLETWINPDAARLAEQQPIFEFAEETGLAGVHFWLSVVDGGGSESAGALFGNVRSVTGEDHLLGTQPGRVVGGEWSHVAMTYDSASGIGSLYLNGILEVSVDLGIVVPQTRQPLYIGYRPDNSADGGGGYTFGGKIDEPGFYARALSASEIAAIHAAGGDGKCLPPTCVSLSPGILAWWPGEGDGTDVVGEWDGALMNGLDFAEGLVGQAFNFDVPGEHLVTPAWEDFAADSFTLEAWVNPDPARLAEQLPIFEFANETGPAGVHFWLSVLDGGGYASEGALFGNVRSVTGANHLLGTPPGRVVGGEWSHVAMTYDSASGVGCLYLNGELEVSAELGLVVPQTRQPLHLGYRPQGSADGAAGFTFGGRIDEPSIYARALSASEIAAIHAARSSGKCPPQGYVLTVGTTPGGTVLRDPDAAAYEPGETVRLTAVPELGFVFDHWQGDVSGTESEVMLLMDGPKQVMAVFIDVAPPEIAIQSPIAGITESASFVLSGTVTDNLGVGSANWEWNGQPLGYLPLNGGQFYVDGLQWALGENRIRVVAVDIVGNEAATEVVVEWVPARLLSVVDPDPRQEGQRIQVTVQLSSSGDVGGASFVLRYNPAYLKQPDLDWSPSVRSALNQVNTDIPGEVRATFALPATAVPAGTRNLAVVTFRARSVPETLTTGLQLRLLDVSDPSGNSIASGSAVRSGQATILVRRVVGDNNANHRLDVGDATLIQRLLTGIDPVRFWDRSGNDVNENTELDSGDVIRVLRAVVRLDPQPLPAGGVSAELGLARANVAPMSDEIAGAIRLEADSLRAAPGELVTVRVRFDEVLSPIAAMALNLEYPVEALRLLNPQSHRVGEAVPATAVAVWNVAPAQNDYTLQSGAVSLAVSSALSWPSSDGAVAEFTFQVQEGQAGQYQWPIRVSQAEISADGYDMAAVADATLYFVGRDPLPLQLTPVSAGLGADGFGFSFQGETGVAYIVEVSSDLTQWVSLGTRVGANEPITISDPAALGAEYRFYRVRFE